MHRTTTTSEPVFGFLSTLETPEYGYFGGYLLINVMGRPLEFHCTAPVKPSRAQQILYGPTLEPYLLGEQIGGTLLRKAQVAPQIVLTDRPATLCLRDRSGVPIVLVGNCVASTAAVSAGQPPGDGGENPTALSTHENVDSCRGSLPHGFDIGGYELRCALGFASDKSLAVELVPALARYVDLAEPFERIHEAIREAQRLGERSQDIHGNAAA